ncbi:histone deacetylase family protein [Halostella pelagica]|uniref:histone deacetylase family protein n=1 Tax=Halostella pelagica TaxID=2583824 RepID=UPI001080CE5E|nr:histone deacetylase [Halostella pelagica]
MKFGYSEVCLDHDTGTRHPETPDRLRAIREGLKREHGVSYVDASSADPAAVEAVHDPEYVAKFREFCDDGGGNWDPDTVAVERTWDAALKSAGLAQWAAETALAGEDGRRTPFAIGRPPGHHAVTDDAMGFCFVNNVAVAAQAALDNDAGVDSVAVIDWDVHHGNGTQEIFYDRDDVFFVSIHEDGIYPGTGEVDETGEGAGGGYTMNVPLPAGSGDAEYAGVAETVVTPALVDFDPDLLLVSAGFDAHRHDPISRMRVSTEGYGVLTDRVRSIADDTDAALGFVLEGGYGLDVLAEGVRMVHEVFDGRSPVEPENEVNDDVDELRDELRRVHGLGEK